MSSSIKGSDEKAKLIKKVVHETEKNMANLKDSVQGYLRNTEKIRGKRLQLAIALKSFSESETPGVQSALVQSAEALVDLEEYRKYMHDRIQVKVGEPINLYKGICQTMMEEIKSRESAVVKEQKKQSELDRMTISEIGNRQKITQIEIETAAQNLVHVNQAFVEHVGKFQSRKIHDVKAILNELMYSEMQYHAKALEILTATQADINQIDMQSDLDKVLERIKIEREE